MSLNNREQQKTLPGGPAGFDLMIDEGTSYGNGRWLVSRKYPGTPLGDNGTSTL